jgi:hypothetical protein
MPADIPPADDNTISEEGSQADQRESRPDDALPVFGDALAGLLRGVLSRSRNEVERLASDGRARLELRQLRKDRSRMYGKLGKEVRALLEAEEVSHPGLARGVERIRELDDRITKAEAAFAASGEVVPAEVDADDDGGV